MRFRHIIFFLLFLSSTAQAFELIMIQAVSDSRRTFITRNGKRQGVAIGVKGTFTADNVSILARATNVTGNFTQWEIINPEVRLPFEKGAVVTYYPATEYMWALAPESERRKYILSQHPEIRQSVIFKGALSRGLSESTSDAPPGGIERGGYVGEFLYEQQIYSTFCLDVGFRYDSEVLRYTGSSLTTTRYLALADVLYYLTIPEKMMKGRVYFSLGAGYGRSITSNYNHSQAGSAWILPSVKVGLSVPFNDDWDFLSDVGFETIQTNEEQVGGFLQTTTQANAKVSIGIRKYY